VLDKLPQRIPVAGLEQSARSVFLNDSSRFHDGESGADLECCHPGHD